MKKYKFKINEQTYETEIAEFSGSNCRIIVNGTSYEVEIMEDAIKQKTPILARKPIITKPEEANINSQSATAFKVLSPLPGSIIKINVNVGDSVKEGDCLIVMEAMKMENEIVAAKAGVVAGIHVKEGQVVNPGDALITIN